MSWWDDLLDIGLTLYGAHESKKAAQDIRQTNYEDILKLLAVGDRMNNPNVRGIFSGWERYADPQTGRMISQQTINPAMAPGLDQFVDRFNAGPQTGQLEQLQNSLFTSMMGPRGPSPPPERRSRPPLKSQFQDEQGNRIPGFTRWAS